MFLVACKKIVCINVLRQAIQCCTKEMTPEISDTRGRDKTKVETRQGPAGEHFIKRLSEFTYLLLFICLLGLKGSPMTGSLFAHSLLSKLTLVKCGIFIKRSVYVGSV